MLTFQQKLNSALTDKGWSQSEFLNRLHNKYPNVAISSSSLSMYINGKRKPSNTVIKAIADTLGVSPSYLIGFTDNPKPFSTIDINDHLDFEKLTDEVESKISEPLQENTNFNVTTRVVQLSVMISQLSDDKQKIIFDLIRTWSE